jgi:hypothetical protein
MIIYPILITADAHASHVQRADGAVALTNLILVESFNGSVATKVNTSRKRYNLRLHFDNARPYKLIIKSLDKQRRAKGISIENEGLKDDIEACLGIKVSDRRDYFQI